MSYPLSCLVVLPLCVWAVFSSQQLVSRWYLLGSTGYLCSVEATCLEPQLTASALPPPDS